MAYPTNNLRIKSSRIVLPPIFLEEELPITDNASRTVFDARHQIVDILNGSDDRLVVVVGPCSIHDPIAAREYAGLLKEALLR
jgi:3-deoxy-7-phosphoheptulonate synthase